MGIRLATLITTSLIAGLAPMASAGKFGFSGKQGGGKKDPLIKVSGSIAPDSGAIFSLTEETANQLYTYNTVTGFFNLSVPMPVLPKFANGGNQFIKIDFPMKITSKKIKKTLVKNSGLLAGNSFLTANLQITDENSTHVAGVAFIGGKSVQATAEGKKAKKMANFPAWVNSKGKSLLVGKDTLAYIADTDDDLQTIEAFSPGGNPEESTAAEVRVRLNEVGGVIVNGYWVLKVGDGTGQLPAQPKPTITSFSAKHPLTPPAMKNGNPVVESFTNFIVEYSEPIVPESVGWNASEISKFNATNPVIPLVYNGNTVVIPNPDNVQVPFYPNFTITATPNGVATFTVPFNVRPINPNNLSQFVFNPLIDLAGDIDLTLTGIAETSNNNATTLPSGQGIPSSATSLYDVRFDDNSAAASTMFHTFGTRAFVNVPVAPQALYYAPLSGTGLGAINLNGQGYETNAPSTEKLLILTNLAQASTCVVGGSFLFGCNPNTFGDATGASAIGIGGNPVELGGSTPVPGVNEGSVGTTANKDNPLSFYPAGFEVVCRDSKGESRLARAPVIGSISDMSVGDFLDKLFFDTLNPWNGVNNHTALSLGGIPVVGNYLSNNISDPPIPNPPPLRLPVGLPPPDVVFSLQELKQPAYVIEGDEVFTVVGIPLGRVMLQPNPTNPFGPDLLPTFPQNGPSFQSFTAGGSFSARQQIGNFLYVADRDHGVVQVLNSNNFSVVQTVETPDPEGVSVSPDLRTLYVSNFGDDSLSIIDVDPWSSTYLEEINRVKVGSGPRNVAAQPGGEDIFVCNFIGDSVSIFDPVTQSIRNTLQDSIQRPWEIVLTQRHFGTGWLSANYQGYICNQGGNNIPIYESGPSGTTGVGADGIRWFVDLPNPLMEMRGMTLDVGTYPGSATGLPGGVYATHRDEQTGLSMVTRCAWTTQTPAAGALPPSALPSSIINNPGAVQRRFEVVGSSGGPLVQTQQQLNFGGQDQVPYDVAMIDISAKNFFSIIPSGTQTNLGGFVQSGVTSNKSHLRGGGATVAPDRMYVSFPGDNLIEVIDPNTGQLLNRITDVPVVGQLAGYFDQ